MQQSHSEPSQGPIYQTVVKAGLRAQNFTKQRNDRLEQPETGLIGRFIVLCSSLFQRRSKKTKIGHHLHLP